MVSVEDILYKIARDFRGYTENDSEAAIREFFEGITFDIHLVITTDLEETGEYFYQKYGKGSTYYFRLADYDHGRQLAAQLYFVFYGKHPDMSSYTGAAFSPTDRLYLSVHVRNLEVSAEPVPAFRTISSKATQVDLHADYKN